MISHKEAREQAKEIVSQMTLAEKISQLNFRAPSIERLGIEEYNYWNEGLHGVARAGVATMFPQAIGLAAMFDDDQLKRVAEVISTEGRAKYNQYQRFDDRDIYKGLTYWSPNINIFRDPRWGRGHETYGEDPYLTSRLGVSFIKGLQGNGKYLKLAACAKHFAVHSGPEADRHWFNAEVSQKDLHETYLPAFEAAVKEADVESFMGAYNAVNGVPACGHDYLLNRILRGEWQFEGHVVSDYAALEDIHLHHKYTDSASETMALAMKVGCNLCAGNISDALVEALDDNIVSESDITSSVEALYTTRVRLGMFADDCEYDDIPFELNDSAGHHEIALEATRKSMVMLKNDDYLPLDKEKISSIAVIGPNAASKEVLQGNYFGTASKYVSFLEGIQNEVSDKVRVYYALGCHLFKDHAESTLSKKNERESEALITVSHADITVLCLGLDATIEGEQGDSGNVYGSGDKKDLRLPGKQQQLLEKVLEMGKPVILVLGSGSSLALDGLENHPQLKAIIQAWYPGSQGGTALAEIIFGKISPSGKLPITFYQSIEELPDFSDYDMSRRTYRNMIGKPLYPFGYGLTYSKVKILNSKLVNGTKKGCLSVEVIIKNIGERELEEVVQVYTKVIGSKFSDRNYKLVNFKRISLSRNEQRSIKLEIPLENLLVVDDHGNRILDGEFIEVYAGVTQPDARSEELTGIKCAKEKIFISELRNIQ